MRRYGYLLAACLSSVTAIAAEPVQYNMITLSAEARRDVPNDQATAVMFVEYSDADAAVLADKVNRVVGEGLKQAKAYSTVRSSVGGNSTYPVYTSNNKTDGWRARAEIRLESSDIPKLAELIGKLQGAMQLGGLSFSIAAEHRDHEQTELIDQAIAAFRARADMVRKSLGGTQYKLVSMNINTQGNAPSPRFMALRADSKFASSPTAPVLDAGQTPLSVEINGTVQIQ
jgi:predicted secreted protein